MAKQRARLSVKQVAKKVEQGWSISKIAEHYGVTWKTVATRIKKEKPTPAPATPKQRIVTDDSFGHAITVSNGGKDLFRMDKEGFHICHPTKIAPKARETVAKNLRQLAEMVEITKQ